MLENIDKSSDEKVFRSDMDDGGRCLLDVINDPQLFQSFLDNSNTATSNNKKDDTSNSLPIINKIETTTKKEVKAKKSIVATKSSPVPIINDLNHGRQATLVSGGNTLTGGIIMDSKQTLNMAPNSVGMMPLSITSSLPANAQSISIQQPLSTLHPSTALSSNSNALRASNPSVFPQAQIQIGPRSMTVLPQQLIVPGMPMAQPGGISQILLTSRPPNPTSSIQPGQVLQFIQTSQGTQILPTNPTTSLQSIVTTTTTSSSKSSNSRSNKQILPKPLSSSASASSTPSKSTSQASNIKLIQQQSGATTFNSQPINTNTNMNSTPQFVIGSGPQHTGIITGPQGTFLLNNVLSNIGSQQFLFQGNMQNPVQLAIRPQAPLFVNNNSLTSDQANLSIALSNNAQIATSKSQSSQPQTFVFSNSAAPPVSSSNNLQFRANAPNFFIRPQFIGAQQPSQPQFLQIQTPNGPLLVALNSGPQTILGPQATPNVQPSTIQIGNTVFSLAANPSLNLQPGAHPLQTIITQPQDNSNITNANLIQPNIATSISTSTPLIINSPSSLLTKTQPIVSPSNIHVVGQQSPKTNSAKGVNLAELLKETGILSDCSPPTSPKNSVGNTELNSHSVSTPTVVDATHPASNTTPQSTVLMVPGGLNSPQNLLLAQNSVTPQLRFSIAPDGTLVLLPSSSNALNPPNQVQISSNLNAKSDLSNSQKDPSGIGSSQPSPDSTTPSIDTTATSSPTSVPQSISSLSNLSNANDKKPIQSLSNSLSNENSSFKFVYDKPVTTSAVNGNITQFVVKTSSVCEQNQTASNFSNTSLSSIPNQNLSLNTAALSVFTTRSTSSCDTSNVTTSCSENIHLAASNSSTSQKAFSDPVNLITGSNTQIFSTQPSSVTLADANGAPILQINSNNKEFMSRLDTQLKSLSALKNPSMQQKELTQELSNMQQKLLQPQTMQNVGLSIQFNVSLQAQQLLQISKSLPSNQQTIALGSNQIGNIILSNNSTNKDNLQFLINQNQLNQNTIQLVSSPLINASLGLLPQSLSSDSQGIPANITSKSNASILMTKEATTKINVNVPLNRIDPGKSRPGVLKAIQQQYNADQNAALHPDCRTLFKSRDDACKRLLRYHVFDITKTWTKATMIKFDKLFEDVSAIMNQKKFELYNKYRYLLLKQSMKESPSCEHVMLGRMFVQDETSSLKADQDLVASGKHLPPFPESWLKLESDKQTSLKRKLPIDDFDDEFDHNQAEKEEIADICHMLEDDRSILNTDLNSDQNVLPTILPDDSQLNSNGNQDIACVDELIDQLNSQDEVASSDEHLLSSDHQSFFDSLDNVPLSHNNFIDPTSSSLNMVTDDLEALYSDIQSSDDQLSQATANLSWSSNINCSSVSNSIHNNILGNNNEESGSRMSWNARYSVTEAEAAVAVQSIINSNEESVDLSGIDDLDANIGVDNSVNFDDVEEGDVDDESSFLDSDSIAQQQGFDVQMHCAIKSIMMQSPTDIGPMSSTSQSTNYNSHQSYQYMNTSMNNPTNYNSLPYHMSSHQMMPNNMRTNNIIPYQSSVVNDTMLDEAVKSILS